MDEIEDVFRTICRVCLTTSNRSTVTLVDEKSATKLSSYGQSVLAFANVSITPLDKLPAQMCYNCLFLLKQAIKFKLTCEKSHKELTELVSDSSDTDYKRNVVEYSLYKECLPETSQTGDNVDLSKPGTGSNDSQKELDVCDKTDDLNGSLFGSHGDECFHSEEESDYFPHDDDFEDVFDIKKEKTEVKNAVDFDDILNQMELYVDSKDTEDAQINRGHSVKTSKKISERKIRYNNARRSLKKQFLSEDDIPIKQLKRSKTRNKEEDILESIEEHLNVQEQSQVKNAISTYRYLINKQRRKAILLRQKARSSNTQIAAQTYRNKRSLAWKRDWVAIREAARATRNSPQQCQLCKKMFANSSSLSAHMQRHTTHKYICEHCGKSTTTNSELQSHLVFKHGSGSFLQCHLCDFKSFRKYDMNEHERTHTGERPFACDKCGLTFTRQSVWRRHRRYHQDKRFQCPLCPRRFHFRADMNVHANNVHSRVYMYACSQCGATYAKTSTVRRHLTDKHGIPRDQQGKILRIKKGEPGANFTEH